MFKGEKVTLRAPRKEDEARIIEFSRDIDLPGLDCAYPIPRSEERIRADIASGQKEDGKNIFFAIEADGKYIGDCGLMGVGNPSGTAELGIVIGDHAYWGQGFGRDAVRLLLRYGFHYVGLRRIVLTTQVKNVRAIRCYLACGFVEEGRPRKAIWIEGEYVDLVNMSILRDEWQALNKLSSN
jgi:RimJ/RimL family protein N-acetyltransferase